MDELLPYPKRGIYAPAPSRVKAPSGLLHPQLPKWKAIPFPNFMERRNRLAPVVFLTVALSLCATGILAADFGPSYQVSVDGVELGLVDSRQAVEAAIDRVEARASSILGYTYTLDQQMDYTFHVSLQEDLIPISQVETYLFDQIGEVMKTSVLTVNGKMIGAAESSEELQAALDSIMSAYVNENTISAEFAENVSVTREYTPTTDIKAVADIYSVLTANSIEQVDYKVQAGETFSGIANAHGMSVGELQLLNPHVTDISNIHVNDTLMISQAVPFLSVQTVDNVTYNGPVAFEVEEVPDNSMYQGNSKVLTPGVEGEAIYNADVTYYNGVEQERSILSVNVLTQPVTQVVAVGTMPRPKTMATGSFIWPLRGSITSGYGTRYIFGSYSYHSGIDIAGSYGASIVAADGGKVIFAGTGTGSSWSYGNYVVIDHENGLQTLYAHCSSLCVSVGERVYQGQTVARVGSTGRSTGNHCHFQVKVNGTTVNPWSYLP
ncbi:MAG: M23 family metallopeptidase [Oscillospiraceae bacterium]|nr:M23 family metallopeptidase [Oscillospiraceae bacterium]